MTLYSEKVNRKTKKRKKRHGTVSHLLRYCAVPSGKSRGNLSACRTYADKDERSVLVRHMHPISDFSALRGIYETAFFPTDLLGEKPAGKLCARIDLNSFAGDAQAWC